MTTERLLGEHKAKLEAIQADVVEIKTDLKQLNQFRWFWMGKLAVYSGAISMLVTAVMEYIVYRK